ncbi:hypothetical protein [Cyclobacterium qasimii]|uniref:Uncharacterized protein n=2 Tax=Cyclobacterium qasimii TaxID=1350429 RepID=S7V7W1_9BACT|nr:hypothetical protein [Cyclobacterium qasimii]EPR66340.1 hypothetical protein ADICYQ_4474 [Cyclobacterium qasimii M12-11B]GEO21185.1 hypothetical protein CQA01_17190 [Cyclobacterium qasimii]
MHDPDTEHKQVLIKSFAQITELENALKAIHEIDSDKMALSIIGNLGDTNANNPKQLAEEKKQLHTFFKEFLGNETNFDTFYNPEIGYLFIVGFLVLTFLNPVGGRTIGALSGGPYGILRGLGISETEAILNVQKLHDGNYLFLARGKRLPIEKLQGILKSLENPGTSQ